MPVPPLFPLDRIDPAAVDALLDQAFGADRRGRTAYRLREGTRPIPALSFAALDGGALVGSIQSWPVAIEIDDGTTLPMVMVGPVAVAPDHQGHGIGRALVDAVIAAADADGASDSGRLMMIGDPDYYGRFFGFSADATGGWRLPGPVERHRLLLRARDADRLRVSGTVVPRRALTDA